MSDGVTAVLLHKVIDHLQKQIKSAVGCKHDMTASMGHTA